MSQAFYSRFHLRALRAVTLAAGAAVVMPTLAADYHWNVADGTWQNGPNWNPFGEPMSADRALIDFASNATAHVLTGVPEVAQVSITHGDTLSLEHDGLSDGAVVDDGDFFVGGSSAGTLNVLPRAGGIRFTGQGHLFVDGTTSGLVVGDNGTVNQSGGIVTIGSESDLNSNLRINTASSYYNFTGGTLTAGYATLANSGSLNISNGEVDVSGMVISNSARAVLNSGSLNIQNVGAGTGELLVEADYFQNGGTLTAAATTLDAPGAFMQFNTGTINCGDLSIHNTDAVRLRSGGDKVLRVSSLHIDPNTDNGGYIGGIDLADNAMVVDYSTSSPLLSIAQYIAKGGLDNDNQIPTGIYSSTAQSSGAHPTAIGFAEASAFGITTFGGQTVDDTSVLIRCTYLGDANLDGTVNALDFNVLAGNFGQSGRWFNGDFDGNHIVNTADFMDLAQNFGQTLSPSLPGQLVPEPACLAAVGLMMCARRRRSGDAEIN